MRNIPQFIDKTLNTRVSPMVYIMAAVSGVIGFVYCFMTYLPDVQHSLLYQHGQLGALHLWGLMLMLTAFATISGLASRHDGVTKMGAMIGFCTWLYAVIIYISGAFYFAAVSYAVFHMVFYGYVYLATTMGYIRRLPVHPNFVKPGD